MVDIWDMGDGWKSKFPVGDHLRKWFYHATGQILRAIEAHMR